LLKDRYLVVARVKARPSATDLVTVAASRLSVMRLSFRETRQAAARELIFPVVLFHIDNINSNCNAGNHERFSDRLANTAPVVFMYARRASRRNRTVRRIGTSVVQLIIDIALARRADCICSVLHTCGNFTIRDTRPAEIFGHCGK